MPPVVTGAIVALIGLNLAPVAWDGGGSGGVKAQPIIAVVTLTAILLATVVFRGFLADCRSCSASWSAGSSPQSWVT